jgi:drug/metabolite transporter (DMT)-like permease
MKNKTSYLTLLACAVTAFLYILTRYVLAGGNPSNRMGYVIFMSLVPALGALLLLRLTRIFRSWPKTAAVYFLLFVLTSIIQVYGRMIPIK